MRFTADLAKAHSGGPSTVCLLSRSPGLVHARLIWVILGLQRFDRLGLLDVDKLPRYRGPAPHRQDFILPCVTGLLFLIAASTGFIRGRGTREGAAESAIITIFGPH